MLVIEIMGEEPLSPAQAQLASLKQQEKQTEPVRKKEYKHYKNKRRVGLFDMF